MTPLNFAFKRRRRPRRDVDEAFCGKIAGAKNFLLAKLRCKRARHCGNTDEMRVFVAFCAEFFIGCARRCNTLRVARSRANRAQAQHHLPCKKNYAHAAFAGALTGLAARKTRESVPTDSLQRRAR
ncbi:MAG TPA: hypothetical protein VMJ52_09135 [Xanthobacteraceae bacterium]|nr:hypothetical protein [Xanthobacteraceae bacterium]